MSGTDTTIPHEEKKPYPQVSVSNEYGEQFDTEGKPVPKPLEDKEFIKEDARRDNLDNTKEIHGDVGEIKVKVEHPQFHEGTHETGRQLKIQIEKEINQKKNIESELKNEIYEQFLEAQKAGLVADSPLKPKKDVKKPKPSHLQAPEEKKSTGVSPKSSPRGLHPPEQPKKTGVSPKSSPKGSTTTSSKHLQAPQEKKLTGVSPKSSPRNLTAPEVPKKTGVSPKSSPRNSPRDKAADK